MQFTIDRIAFADVLSFAGRSVADMRTGSVLIGVVITTHKDDKVVVCGFNEETASKASAFATVSESGRVLVPAHPTIDMVKSLTGETIEVFLDNGVVVLRSGAATFRVVTMPLDEYPSSNVPKLGPVTGTIDSQLFATGVAQTAFAALRENEPAQLTGVSMQLTGSRMVLCATDRYRLAYRILQWDVPENAEVNASVLLPRVTIDMAARALAGAGTLHLHLPPADQIDGWVGFSTADRAMIARQLGGEYPPVETLFPATYEMHATFNTGELLEVLRRGNFAIGALPLPMKISLAPGQARLHADSDDFDAEAFDETVTCGYDGKEVTVGLAPGYLISGLDAAKSEIVVLSILRPELPVVLSDTHPGSGDTDTVPKYRYLVTPLRVTRTA